VGRSTESGRCQPAGAAAGARFARAVSFRNETRERTVVGALPVDVPFPEFGPSIFLAAELTAEARLPVVDLAVRRIQD
jgi:hypothetical protein